MQFFKDLALFESQKAAQKEVDYTISTVNKIYNEWKKTGRRINAVDIVTTSMNKIANINPTVVDQVHEATRFKIATIIMRCMDLAPWKPLDSKEKIYKKLFPIIDRLQNYDMNTGTTGTLKEVIMTRLSAAVATQSKNPNVFVAYEKTISNTYLKYLFGAKPPEKTFKMAALNIPADYESLLSVLEINHEKAVSRFKNAARETASPVKK